MRILFLTMEYPPDTGIGGIGFNVAGMVPALVERGHDVHVLSCYPGQRARDETHDGAVVHRRPMVRLPGLDRVIPGPHASLRIRAALSTYREYRRLDFEPDVVNMPDWMGEGLLFGLLRTKPLVAYLHTPLHLVAHHNGAHLGRPGRLADMLERAAVRRATVVTSTSRLLADDLGSEGWLGRHDGDVRVIPPPIDSAAFAGVVPVEGTAPVLLAVGRVEPRKAPEDLVAAAARLKIEVPDLQVVLAGRSSGTRDGIDFRQWVEQRATDLGVPCLFLDHVPRPEVLEWYGRARVVAVPSRYESFSITALEGAAAGRPVVCSDRVGAAEVLAEAGDLFFPVGDVPALADRLRPFLLDPGAAAEQGRRARALVVEHCSPAVVAERREAVYVEAVERFESRRGRR